MPVIRYALDSNTPNFCHNICSEDFSVTHLIPVIMFVLKFLTDVMTVIRYVAWSYTSYSSYKVWSEAAGTLCLSYGMLTIIIP